MTVVDLQVLAAELLHLLAARPHHPLHAAGHEPVRIDNDRRAVNETA